MERLSVVVAVLVSITAGSIPGTAQTVETIAGSGGTIVCPVSSGLDARLSTLKATAMAFDPTGTAIYFADTSCPLPSPIRRINLATHVLDTAYWPDFPNKATNIITGLAFDSSGTLYFSVGSGSPTNPVTGGVYRLDPTTQSATLVYPMQSAGSLLMSSSGSLIAVEQVSGAVLSIDPKDGTAATIASGLSFTYDGIVGGASKTLYATVVLALDSAGSVIAPDFGHDRLLKIDKTGVVTTIAGGGNGGDGDPAALAALADPSIVVIDPAGNIFIDPSRYIDAASGTIVTLTTPGLSSPALFGPDGYLYWGRFAATSSSIYRFKPLATYDIFEVTPKSYDFGDVPAFGSRTQTFFVTNSSTHSGMLGLSTLFAPFSLTTDCPVSPTLIASGASCRATVLFVPTSAALNSSGLLTASNAVLSVSGRGTKTDVSVSGRGVSAGLLQITPDHLDFGDVPVGTAVDLLVNPARQITVTNAGSGPAKIQNIAPLAGSDFSLRGGNCPTSLGGQMLAVGQSCFSLIGFSPSAAGARTGVVRIYDDTADSPHNVILTGNGTGPAALVTGNDGAGLKFSRTLVGSLTQALNLTLTSNGTAPIQIVGWSGLPYGSVVLLKGCSNALNPGSTCSMDVAIVPSYPSTAVYTLSLTTNGPRINVPVTVTAYQVSIASSLTFGTQAVGTTSAGKNLVLNTVRLDSPTVTLTGDFVLLPSSDVRTCLATMTSMTGTCTATIAFAPTGDGNRQGSFVLSGSFGEAGQVSFRTQLSGTGQSVDLLPSPPTVSVSAQAVGSTSPLPASVTFTNVSVVPISITALTATNGFSVTSDCTLAPLSPQGSCSTKVFFTPTSVGTASGTLVVTGNMPHGAVTVPLSSAGFAPYLSLSVTSLTFGEAPVGTYSASQYIDALNITPNRVAIGEVTAGPDFAISSYCNFIDPGQTCRIGVQLAPEAVGRFLEPLRIIGNPPLGTYTLALSGTGIAPFVQFSKTKLAYPNTPVGRNSGPESFDIINVSSVPVSVWPPYVLFPWTPPADYTLYHFCSAPLPPGGRCTVVVSFVPQAAGDRNSQVHVETSPGGTSYVSLVGTAVIPALDVPSQMIDFGNQTVGTQSAARTIPIRNISSRYVSFPFPQVSGGDFPQTGNCTSLAPGQSCQLQISFVPHAAGEWNSATYVISDEPASYRIDLRGTGVVSPALQFSPSSLSFPAVNVGGSATLPMTMKNMGSQPLAINSVYTSGTSGGTAGFSVNHDCGTSLAVGASCTLTIIFTPPVAGLHTGWVEVLNNSAIPLIQAPLSGTGVDFAVSAASGSGSASVSAGQTATYQLTLASNGFAGNVNLACSGVPAYSACAVSPVTAALASGGTAGITVSVTTTARTTVAHGGISRWSAIVLLFFSVLLWRTRRGLRTGGVLGTVCMAIFLTSCGGGGSQTIVTTQTGTPAGSYTVVVSATSGTTVRSLNLALNVQ